jgi:hypothetical protein
MTELYGNNQKHPVYGYLVRELLFIDTDGVLADGMKEWSDKLGLSTKELFDKKLYHVPGFYLDLPPMPGAVEAKKCEVYILTSPSWENPSYRYCNLGF